MKWQGRRQSSNVSDRRSSGGVRRGASVGCKRLCGPGQFYTWNIETKVILVFKGL